MKDLSDISLWRFGANFIPSTAVNQLEMWQADSFDPVTIDRELGWGAAVGMQVMRVYLHDLLFEQDADGFIRRIEQYLTIADKYNIRTVFVFFDDCWNNEFALGKQPAPKPFGHNSGWVKSPGRQATGDLRQYPRLERYVKGVIQHFRGDKRILMWDLYNEPGNGDAGDHETLGQYQGSRSLGLLKAVFDWALSCDPTQPVTVGVWSWEPAMDELNQTALELSEVVSFHSYLAPEAHKERMDLMRFLAQGRPIVCTEYMARRRGSTFQGCLPMMQQANCTAINWGLVAGKTNTIYPWNWKASDGEPELYFHDVFRADGSALYADEVAFLKTFKRN